VTALCTLIVAGSLCYLVKLLIELKDQFGEMRERMAVHFAEDESLGERIKRMEEHLDRLTKLRSIRSRIQNDD
jgi:predicted nuclease with TOPRIM domain